MYRPSRRSLKAASPSPSPRSTTSTSTTPSPSWKEALRRECIERARRRRTERVSRARAAVASAGSAANVHVAARDEEARRLVEEGLRAVGNVNVVPSSSSATSSSSSGGATPRSSSTPPEDDGFLFRGAVEAPKQFAFGATPSTPAAAAMGVDVNVAPFVFGSSGANANATATPRQQGQPQHQQGQSYQTPPCHSNPVSLPPRHDASHYYINEEELFELMREVEDELQREEAMLIQEIQEVERQRQREDEYVQEQIAHYEEFVEGGQHDEGDAAMEQLEEEEVAPQHVPAGVGQHVPAGVGQHVGVAGADAIVVPCPVCRGANLIQTRANVIVCPNSSACSPQQQRQKQPTCNLRLDLNGEGLTLDHLRRTLEGAQADHAAACPSGVLRFAVRDEFGVTTLRASCVTCLADVVVL